MLKQFVLILSWFSAILWHGAVYAQVGKPDYQAFVGINGSGTGFKSLQAPVNLVSASLGTSYAVKRLDYEVFGDYTGRLKFFLPPGTIAFNANLYYYLAPQEGKVALRLGNIPLTPLSSISAANAGGVVNETVLRNLAAGQEVLFYSAGAPANSLVLSSPDQVIEPVVEGGYVYGNFQYPGDILQRGLIQVFVRSDCYEQWYNSATTQWDVNGNPSEATRHTCSGSIGGGDPLPALEGILASPSNVLQVGSGQTLTLSPIPSTAVLPTCTVRGTPHVSITGNRVSLLSSANGLTSNTVQTIVCGNKTLEITLVPIVTDGVRVEKLPSTVDGSGNLVVNFKLLRRESSVAGKSNTTVWIGARIPKDGFFFTEDEWFFLTPVGWEVLVLPNPMLVKYQTIPARTETTFAIQTGLPAADLGYFNVDIHFGYADDNSVFQDKGVIWSK